MHIEELDWRIPPEDLWPHDLVVRYAQGDPDETWDVACRQCSGDPDDPWTVALLDTPENRKVVGNHAADYEFASLEGIIAAAAKHLEELSADFPRFDPEHVRASGLVAVQANNALPGLEALVEGRTDCSAGGVNLEGGDPVPGP